MCRACLFVSAVLMFLTGCASSPKPGLNAVFPAQQLAVQQRLREVFDAAEKKEMDRLDSYHFYGPKFSKFGVESRNRQDAASARLAEHTGLEAATSMAMQAEDLKVDVLGDTAVATFILNYSFLVDTDRVAKKARSTLVFVNDAGSWKIVHEHFSEF